jgi:succinate dehydrogenase hydrophobic anchor subunit
MVFVGHGIRHRIDRLIVRVSGRITSHAAESFFLSGNLLKYLRALFGKTLGSIFGDLNSVKQTMNWFTNFFSSTIGRKVVMALTGLFLILFLVIHLIGNLQLLKSDSGQSFNIYAQFMTSNPLIKVISYVNYAFILIHIIWSIILTRKNRRARGGLGYALDKNPLTGPRGTWEYWERSFLFS